MEFEIIPRKWQEIPFSLEKSDPSLEILQAQMRSLQIQNSVYFDPHWRAEKWKKIHNNAT